MLLIVVIQHDYVQSYDYGQLYVAILLLIVVINDYGASYDYVLSYYATIAYREVI